MATKSRYLASLYDEHRSIAAVLHGMQYLVRETRERGTRVDAEVFRAMLYYLDVFPERMHHPKEEEYLFKRLRERSAEAGEVLDELAREHNRGGQAIRDLEQDLLRLEAGGERELPAFAAAVESFIDGYWAHMRREEHEVMPLAEQVLTPEDWAEIEAAWASNQDPIHGFGAEADYRRLFSRIVNLAPPPIGLGPTG
jgi:hemerythrin-like domain-containing protein